MSRVLLFHLINQLNQLADHSPRGDPAAVADRIRGIPAGQLHGPFSSPVARLVPLRAKPSGPSRLPPIRIPVVPCRSLCRGRSGTAWCGAAGSPVGAIPELDHLVELFADPRCARGGRDARQPEGQQVPVVLTWPDACMAAPPGRPTNQSQDRRSIDRQSGQTPWRAVPHPHSRRSCCAQVAGKMRLPRRSDFARPKYGRFKNGVVAWDNRARTCCRFRGCPAPVFAAILVP